MTASDDVAPRRRELTVLVLEEEADVRELIVDILELHEFCVLPARDHGEGIRREHLPRELRADLSPAEAAPAPPAAGFDLASCIRDLLQAGESGVLYKVDLCSVTTVTFSDGN